MTFGFRPQRMAEQGFNANDRGWAAYVVPSDSGDSTKLAVTLKFWSVNQSGFIWNGGRYAQMLDGLVSELDGRYLSEPLRKEDYRFISRSL